MDCDARVKYDQFFDQTTKHKVSGNYVKGDETSVYSKRQRVMITLPI